MKFCKTWSHQMASLHPDLKLYCIHYKQLKKSLKAKHLASHESFQSSLEKQCQMVDKVFKMYSTSCDITKTPLLSWCNRCLCYSHATPITIQELVSYAKLNQLSLRKICKKRDKIWKTNLNMNWLSKIQSLHKFAFMGSDTLTKLCIQSSSECPNDECPVCLDDFGGDKPHIILACGHIVCYECMCKLLKITSLKGTIKNLIAQQEAANGHTRCPICRYHKAFHSINHHSVWPNHYINLFSKVNIPKST